MNDDIFAIFRILVVGDTGVGKTTLLHRYVHKTFLPDFKATIGVDFFLKTIHLNINNSNQSLVLQLWDLAGQVNYRTVFPYYSAGTQGLILMFDATNYNTLDNLYKWINIIKYTVTQEIPVILVSTKHDFPESKIHDKEINIFKKTYQINHYYLTSAKSGLGVDTMFETMVTLLSKTFEIII